MGICITPGAGSTARFFKTNGCCAPMPGPCNALVTKGLNTVEISPQTDETEALTKPRLDGELCINRPARQRFSNLEVTVGFCALPLDAFQILSDAPVMYDYNGVAVGFTMGEGFLDLSGWGFELWLTEDSGTQCDPTGLGRFLYLVVPCLQSAVMGDLTIESGSTVDFTFTATSRKADGYCRGPWDVQEQFEGDTEGGPLITPIPAGAHFASITTGIAPPEEDCDCVPVPDVDLGCPSPGESP